MQMINGQPTASPDKLQAIQNLKDLITGATTYAPTAEHAPEDESTNLHNNMTSNSDPVPGPIHITPVPSPIHIFPDPLQTAPPPRIEHTRPHVILLHNNEYDPPPNPEPLYNLRPREHTVLSTIKHCKPKTPLHFPYTRERTECKVGIQEI